MYPAKHRLRLKKEVLGVIKTGKGRSGRFLRVKHKKNDLGYPRFAVVVGKKVAKSAVTRNKKKRQIRENLRKLHKNGLFVESKDVVVIGQKGLVERTYQQIGEEISKILGV